MSNDTDTTIHALLYSITYCFNMCNFPPDAFAWVVGSICDCKVGSTIHTHMQPVVEAPQSRDFLTEIGTYTDLSHTWVLGIAIVLCAVVLVLTCIFVLHACLKVWAWVVYMHRTFHSNRNMRRFLDLFRTLSTKNANLYAMQRDNALIRQARGEDGLVAIREMTSLLAKLGVRGTVWVEEHDDGMEKEALRAMLARRDPIIIYRMLETAAARAAATPAVARAAAAAEVEAGAAAIQAAAARAAAIQAAAARAAAARADAVRAAAARADAARSSANFAEVMRNANEVLDRAEGGGYLPNAGFARDRRVYRADGVGYLPNAGFARDRRV
jgi:hypothetical protein